MKVLVLCFSQTLSSKVVRREPNYCGWRQRNQLYNKNWADASAPRVNRKLKTWSHQVNVLLLPPPHVCKHQMYLFQCLSYLPMPCYAVHMCYSNQANFIASGWVDQKDPVSLFFLCLRFPFHVVICTKGRIKVALPPSQPSLFRSVKEDKLGGHACLGQRDWRIHSQVKVMV